MATRKELLKAYSFTSQRLIKALVDRNPDDMTAPLRRVALGSFASVMLAVLIFAGFGVVGWLNPAKTSKWQQDKTVVIDKTSGGVFVYLQDTLYRTYNITSAKLATAGGPTVAVTTKSLRTATKIGPYIGIPAAPSQLPDPASMNGYPIRLCSSAPTGAQRFTTLQIGDPSVTAPTGAPAVLVADDKGGQFLVIGGVAHQAPVIKGTSIAVELGFTTAITPGTAFVSGLAKGAPLVPPPIDGIGGTSRVTVGSATKIGTVLHLAAQNRWFVLLADGKADISAIEAVALRLQSGTKATEVDAADITAARTSATKVRAAGLDDALSTATMVDRDDAICSTWTEDGPAISVAPTDVPAATTQASSAAVADLVVTPPLTGALIQPDNVVDPAGGVSLITNGLRYGIADPDAQAALGYAKTPIRRVPAGLVGLIPQGLPAGQILSIPRAQGKG